jgi:hypothetical protein
MRRAGLQEHPPGAFERIRTATVQVAGDRLAGVGGQRPPLPRAALASDRDLPSAPADVVQRQRGDLPGAQPGSVRYYPQLIGRRVRLVTQPG